MDTISRSVNDYLSWMKHTNYSLRTVEGRQRYLTDFAQWCEERDLMDPRSITEKHLESYRRHVGRLKCRDGRTISYRTQRNRLVPMKSFFRWLRKVGVVEHNPAAEFEMPRMEKRLPKAILSEKETRLLLGMANPVSASGLRDRAILETLYSTGIRRAELAALTIRDVDTGRGLVCVRQGKGRKDRMVPIGEKAVEWILHYLEYGRPELTTCESPETLLFINDQGHPWHLGCLSELVRKYALQAELEKTGGCHLLRHACATHMLDNGADIRHVQEQLGHASLQTTQIYAHVSLTKLKEAHSRSHPSAK